MAYTPVRNPFNLGEIDPGLEGQTVNILVNPKRNFLVKFFDARDTEFLAAISFICGLEDDPPGDGAKTATQKLEDIFGDLDASVWTTLFVGTIYQDESQRWQRIMPHVYKIWNRYADDQIKKLAGR